MTNICVTVRYHQQDNDIYCGAAAAQMIIASSGGILCAQDDLMNGLSSTLLNGGTTPQALQDVLNNKLPSGPFFSQRWDVNVDEGCQTIVAGLLAGSGVAAIVNGSSHWVVVTGANLVGDPAQGPPYTIDSFFFNDPEPETAAIARAADGYLPPPLPHSLIDTCGNKGIYGSADTQVSLGEWLDSYWSAPCTIGNQVGYVTVSSAAQAQADYSADFEQKYVKRFAELASARVHPSAARILSYPDREAAAKRAAEQGIRDHGILANGPLAERLAGYHPGNLTYHTDLGDPPRHSYQIRLMRGRTQIGTACVDADTLKLRGVQAPASIMPTPDEMREMALSALRSHTASLRDILGPFDLAHELFTVHPTLVWRPCRQSMSRYYPFVQVNLAGTILYVGLDGRVHRRLTPHEPD